MTHSDKTNTEATLDLNLGVPQNQADEILFPALDAIRDNDPVFWSEANNSWILTRHDHVLEAFRDRRFSSKGSFLFGMEHHVDLNEVPNLTKYSQDWLMNMDGMDHIRVRKALVPIFSKASIDRYEPIIKEIAVKLIDEIASKGSVEYVMEVAFQLPADVITTILGLDKKHLDDIKRWSDIMVITVLPQHASRENFLAGEQALVEMNALVVSEIDIRRAQPRDDLLTEFMKLIDEGSLTLDEVLSTLQIVLVAGHDTTANSNVLALQALVNNPVQ
jgi:cytochrome P450